MHYDSGIYDQNEYLPEKRRALEAWALMLQGIVSGKKVGDNVITLKSGQHQKHKVECAPLLQLPLCYN